MNSKLKFSIASILMLCILWTTPLASAMTVWEEGFDTDVETILHEIIELIRN
jgi:hypothetical protein